MRTHDAKINTLSVPTFPFLFVNCRMLSRSLFHFLYLCLASFTRYHQIMVSSFRIAGYHMIQIGSANMKTMNCCSIWTITKQQQSLIINNKWDSYDAKINTLPTMPLAFEFHVTCVFFNKIILLHILNISVSQTETGIAVVLFTARPPTQHSYIIGKYDRYAVRAKQYSPWLFPRQRDNRIEGPITHDIYCLFRSIANPPTASRHTLTQSHHNNI